MGLGVWEGAYAIEASLTTFMTRTIVCLKISHVSSVSKSMDIGSETMSRGYNYNL